jgi:general secretion pathway protein G
MKTSRARRRRSGFTLIEVLLVLVILVVLGSLAVTAYGPIREGAYIKSTNAQLGLFKTALSMYKMNLSTYPPSLDFLWICPTDMTQMEWQGPYMEGTEVLDYDAWGTKYQIESSDGYQSIRVSSAGPDRMFGTADDLWMDYYN